MSEKAILSVRKFYRILEDTRIEGGRPVTGTCHVGAVAAVVGNPFVGTFKRSLDPLAKAGLDLGRLLASEMVRLLGGADCVAAYTKAVLVGIDGEIEHGSAIIHTVAFADALRKAANGEAPVPSTEKRGPTGSAIDLSIKGKRLTNTRPFHQTFTIQIADAPFPSEIVVIVGGSSMARPQSRLASREEERRILGAT